ncbi:MAG: S8 family peptidase [Puniceicoccales bacterium]|jgi:hypothetical protein|nr:S8 family peptidase [Puniceicoccales bacterium]
MNPAYPPLQFEPLTTRKFRAKGNKIPQKTLAIETRVTASKNARRIIAEVTRKIRELTPEQKRAVFLKMTHDKPITKDDLAGSGLRFFSPPGATESLVILREVKKTADLGFTTLNQRLTTIEQDSKSDKSLELATHMTGLDIADPKERLCSEFRADYADRITRGFFIYEIEITSFASNSRSKSKELAAHLGSLRRFLTSGTVYEHDDAQKNEGVIRVVLASSGEHFRQLVENPEWRRIVTFFDERPKFETFHARLRDFNIADTTILPPSENAPKICIIDTGVAAGNHFLSPVVDRELSQSFIGKKDEFNALSDANGHGSGVASLAAYHLIDSETGTTHQALAKIVSARITNDDGNMDVVEQQDDGTYRLKEAHLLSKTLEKIVTTLRPHGVRIFVLSYNILGHYWSEANRPAITRKTWVARKIDQLVKEHDILFVGITGNIASDDLTDLHQQTPYPAYWETPLAKLLDPGQASLAVIAGAIANSATVAVSTDTAIASEGAASPFTRSGPGFADSIKPDFVERGGNSVINLQTGAISWNVGTDVVMASGKLTPALQNNRGTSFAAPRIAHHAAQILFDLTALGLTPTACLLRAFLAVSAKSPIEVGDNKNLHLSVYGHGLPDGKTATDCAGHSVLLYHQGTYAPGNVIFLPITVPQSLCGHGRGRKIIRVSIATAPSVQAWGVEDYLSVNTHFRLYRGDEDFDKIIQDLTKPEIEADIPPESSAQQDADAPKHLDGFWKLTLRSNGTLQSDTFSWSDHIASYSANHYTLAISLQKSSWCKDSEPPIPLAVVIRLEDTTGRCVSLYSEVRAAVETSAQARQRVRA